jgi:hypothetical protein
MERSAIAPTAAIAPESSAPTASSLIDDQHPASARAVGEALSLEPGELAEVRRVAEILATLDADGQLDGVPFMPEMLAYSGRQFRVLRRADRTCWQGVPRRFENAVYLDQLRCDGSAHEGCQARCLLLWKEAWLRRAGEKGKSSVIPEPGAALPHNRKRGLEDRTYGLSSESTKGRGGTLRCQTTELLAASCSSEPDDRPCSAINVLRGTIFAGFGPAELRRTYNYVWGKLLLLAFTRWARAPRNISRYRQTPSEKLDLRPGELVRVRGIREILRTLDYRTCNRGMQFTPQMFQFCGRKYRVARRITRQIDERDSKMRDFRNPCILLESVHCEGQRFSCSRGSYHYWREIWLRRC